MIFKKCRCEYKETERTGRGGYQPIEGNATSRPPNIGSMVVTRCSMDSEFVRSLRDNVDRFEKIKRNKFLKLFNEWCPYFETMLQTQSSKGLDELDISKSDFDDCFKELLVSTNERYLVDEVYKRYKGLSVYYYKKRYYEGMSVIKIEHRLYGSWKYS